VCPTSLRRSGPLGWLERVASSRPEQAHPLVRATSHAAKPARPAEPAAGGAFAGAGRALLGGRELEAAERALHELLVHSDDALAWFLLGEACAKRGANAQAKVAFGRACTATIASAGSDLETIRAAAKRRARQCG
jgi:predicted Zn-dependent protease